MQWWEREDLRYRNQSLEIMGQDVVGLAKSVGTPLFLYSAERIKQKLQEIKSAFNSFQIPYRIYYAVKANRFLPLVTYLKTTGLCGIDVCSGKELLLARSCGFKEEDISFTGFALTEEDLSLLTKHSRVWINIDSLSALKRIGEKCPGREIGIRVNPERGVGYNDKTVYNSKDRVTKFGIYKSEFLEAIEIAKIYNLKIKGIHFHVGVGYQQKDFEEWYSILRDIYWFLDQVPNLEKLNLGGGMGVPFSGNESGFPFREWLQGVVSVLDGRKYEIAIEPGDFLVKDSGIIVSKVILKERKNGRLFLGVDAGSNLLVSPAYYHQFLEPIPCTKEPNEIENLTIAGFINEALDELAIEISFPKLVEGDYIAFLNCGGYGSSMSSNHCMRGDFHEQIIFG